MDFKKKPIPECYGNNANTVLKRYIYKTFLFYLLNKNITMFFEVSWDIINCFMLYWVWHDIILMI